MVAAFVGAPGIGGCTGWKGFQGLEGQWKGLLFTSPSALVALVGLEAVVSSSDDSSLAEAMGGFCEGAFGDGGGGGGGFEGEGLVEEGATSNMFLSGDQPGGRRLLNI